MSYAEYTARQRRLEILRLIRDGGDAANEQVLLMALRAMGFPRLTDEALRADIDLLRSCGLITVEWFSGSQVVAQLTVRGIDVAAGRCEVDGVARPIRVG